MHFNFFTDPWHWSFAGVMVSAIMLALTLFGKFFGLSSTYRTLCSIGGAGKRVPFFDFNWKDQVWNLCFVAGIIIGGFLTAYFIPSSRYVSLGESTQSFLFQSGLIEKVDAAQRLPLVPSSLFSTGSPVFGKAVLYLLAGGFLSGFGARYAGGCTSGHFVSGLSNLQQGSLITLIFFMIGGILSTNLLLPFVFHNLQNIHP